MDSSEKNIIPYGRSDAGSTVGCLPVIAAVFASAAIGCVPILIKSYHSIVGMMILLPMWSLSFLAVSTGVVATFRGRGVARVVAVLALLAGLVGLVFASYVWIFPPVGKDF